MPKFDPHLFDEYSFKARYIPAIVSAIPIIVLISMLDSEKLAKIFGASSKFMIYSKVSLSGVSVLFLIAVIRTLGKYAVEHHLFDNQLRFPTTNFLLWRDERFSEQQKRQLHDKIKADFELSLFGKPDEEANLHEARRLAKDAVSRIRGVAGKGGHTKQYNIHYGMFRNLAGGLLISVPVSIVNLILFSTTIPSRGALIVSLVYLLLALVYMSCFMPLLRWMGGSYAEYLFSDYLQKGSVP